MSLLCEICRRAHRNGSIQGGSTAHHDQAQSAHHQNEMKSILETTIPLLYNLICLSPHCHPSPHVAVRFYTMSSSRNTPFELCNLPDDITNRLMTISSGGRGQTVSLSDDEDETQLSHIDPDLLPSTPVCPTHVQSQHSSQAMSIPLSLFTDSPSASQLSVSNGAAHWNQKAYEILSLAIIGSNPNLAATNKDR